MTNAHMEDQVRTTSNPAFRNLPISGGNATFNTTPRGFSEAAARAGTSVARPMTIDDVVIKTGISLAVLIVVGAITWIRELYLLAIPGLIVGLLLALVITIQFVRKGTVNPALVIGYAAAEGALLGAISKVFETKYAGIVPQAIVGTVGVFAGMLLLYRSGAIRVTPRLTRWIVGATIGVLVMMLVNLLAYMITGDDLGLRDGSPLAIGFSLVVIGVAAFSFLLDFEFANEAMRAQLPARIAWYVAFGLLATLIWLYLEIMILLSYFRE